MGQSRKVFVSSLTIKHLIFYIFLITHIASSLKIPKPVKQDLPEIWLSGYTTADSFREKAPDEHYRSRTQFENDYISKTNGTDYVISDEIRSVFFTCEASYPITWIFPFSEQLEYMTRPSVGSRETRTSEIYKDVDEPVNKRFESKITILNRPVDFFSVNLTCSSVENRQVLESSIYIFLKGKLGIEHEGQTFHISLNPDLVTPKTNKLISDLPPLILPCRPGSPDVKLALEKERVAIIPGKNKTVQKTWKPFNFQGHDLSFDPKIGFTLQRGMLGNRIFGLYRCSVILSNDNDLDGQILDSYQFVIINVTKTTNNGDHSHDSGEIEAFKPRSILRGKASVDLIPGELKGHGIDVTLIRCCSGFKDKSPKLYQCTCQSPLACQTVKDVILEEIDSGKIQDGVTALGRTIKVDSEKGCSTKLMFGFNEIVACQDENVDFVEEYIQLFHPLASGPVTNRSSRIRAAKNLPNDDKTKITSLSTYEPASVAESAPISQKVIMLVGKPLLSKNRKLDGLHYIMFNGKILDLLENNGDKNNGTKGGLSLAEKIQRSSAKVLEYPRDVYYVGEPLVFMCFGVKRFYTNQVHMKIDFRNGTKLWVDFENYKETRILVHLRDNGDMFIGNGGGMVSMFGNINASLDMKSVECWMPKVNSSRWDKISKDIEVRNSAGPIFVEAEEETVYFYLGDVGNKMTCTVKEALPFPRVMVLQDGQRLKLDLESAIKKARDRLSKKNEADLINGTKETEVIDKTKGLVTVTLNFGKIAHEDQGIYQCVAKNVNATVTRTIHVFVIDKPGAALPITLSIVGVLCLVIIGLGLKYWHGKRTVGPLYV